MATQQVPVRPSNARTLSSMGKSSRRKSFKINPTSEDPDGPLQRFIRVISDPVEGDYSYNEYCGWLTQQSWFLEHDFDKRVGMGFSGGGLLGVSTSLAHVKDKAGKVVGESMGLHDGKPLALFMDEKNPKAGPHTVEIVWDAPHAAEVAKFSTGNDKIEPNPVGLEAAKKLAGGNERAAPTEWMRPEKKALFQRVSDSLGAMVRALEMADGEAGGHAFFITDYFGLRQRVAQIRQDAGDARITPEDIKNENKILALEPPIIMLRRMCHTLSDLTLIVPYPAEAKLEEEATLAAWHKFYPSRTLLLVPITGSFKITTSFNLLAGITHATRRAPRPCIVGVASGGYGVLDQMAEVSTQRHSVRMLTLHGSGRLSDLWAEAWPRRGEERFDPVIAAKRLHQAACFPPSADHIEAMRRVLAEGELYLHKISAQSSTLERLCTGLLLGDKLLNLADKQRVAYEAGRRKYANTAFLLATPCECIASLPCASSSAPSPPDLPVGMVRVGQVRAAAHTLCQPVDCARTRIDHHCHPCAGDDNTGHHHD